MHRIGSLQTADRKSAQRYKDTSGRCVNSETLIANAISDTNKDIIRQPDKKSKQKNTFATTIFKTIK